MAGKFRFKLTTPKTPYDGWLIRVLNRRTGEWERVSRRASGVVVAFETREQAVRTASRYASHPDYLG